MEVEAPVKWSVILRNNETCCYRDGHYSTRGRDFFSAKHQECLECLEYLLQETSQGDDPGIELEGIEFKQEFKNLGKLLDTLYALRLVFRQTRIVF